MAQAILLEDVEASASAANRSTSPPGYLRNYLVPRKLAAAGHRRARSRRRSDAARRPKRRRRLRAEREAQAAALLSKTVLTIHQRAGDDGKLFGSVGAKEIADAIREARDLRIDRRKSASSSRSAKSAPSWWRSSSPTAPSPR